MGWRGTALVAAAVVSFAVGTDGRNVPGASHAEEVRTTGVPGSSYVIDRNKEANETDGGTAVTATGPTEPPGNPEEDRVGGVGEGKPAERPEAPDVVFPDQFGGGEEVGGAALKKKLYEKGGGKPELEVEKGSDRPKGHEVEKGSDRPEEHKIENGSGWPEGHEVEKGSDRSEEHKVEKGSGKPEGHEAEKGSGMPVEHEVEKVSDIPEEHKVEKGSIIKKKPVYPKDESGSVESSSEEREDEMISVKGKREELKDVGGSDTLSSEEREGEKIKNDGTKREELKEKVKVMRKTKRSVVDAEEREDEMIRVKTKREELKEEVKAMPKVKRYGADVVEHEDDKMNAWTKREELKEEAKAMPKMKKWKTKKSNADLLSYLGLEKLKSPAVNHHRKRLASQSRKTPSKTESKMFFIKLPPEPYYFARHDELEAKSRPAAALPVSFSSNGKPSRIYHWNLPLMMNMVGRKAGSPKSAVFAVDKQATWDDAEAEHPPHRKTAYYAPKKNKEAFRKYFAGNGKPHSFYVMGKSDKPRSTYKLLR